MDVGFRDAYRLPIRLDERAEQVGVGAANRLDLDGQASWRFYERLASGGSEFHCAFTLSPCRRVDLAEACRHYESSPKSSLTQKRISSRATEDDQVSLTNRRPTVSRHDTRVESTLAGELLLPLRCTSISVSTCRRPLACDCAGPPDRALHGWLEEPATQRQLAWNDMWTTEGSTK